MRNNENYVLTLNIHVCQKKQDNNTGSTSTFTETGGDNPWDLNMFNHIELDQVLYL